MAAWYWSVHVSGRHGRAYNVGGQGVVSIGQVAAMVAQLGRTSVKIASSPGGSAGRSVYVPDTRLIREELGARETISLGEAIAVALHWERLRRDD
jgi:dTDP-glucose 4,6-dehydratase